MYYEFAQNEKEMASMMDVHRDLWEDESRETAEIFFYEVLEDWETLKPLIKECIKEYDDVGSVASVIRRWVDGKIGLVDTEIATYMISGYMRRVDFIDLAFWLRAIASKDFNIWTIHMELRKLHPDHLVW